MALPTDVATLYAWYQASSLALNEGDEVSAWLDSSGAGRTMTGATGGASKPKYRANQIAGYPAVEIGTTVGSGYLVHASFGWLANLASHTVFVVWRSRASGGGGIVTSLGGGASEAINRRLANVISKRWANTVPTTFTADAALNDLEWHYACAFQTGNTQIGISADGGSETTTATTGTRSASVTTEARIGQDAGTYCDGWLAEVIVYSSSLSSGDKAIINGYLRDKYFAAAPGQNEQIRDTLSRRLWMLRRAPGILEVDVPLWLLDADILDRIAVEAEYGPAPQAAGWRGKKWQRRAFTVQRQEWNVGQNTVRLTLLDRRPLDVLLWDTACTDERNSGARQSGVARMMKGIGFTFSRQSQAWPVNPADSTAVTYCANNERAISGLGELLEEARTNECFRSSFVSGTTGLTLAGTGVSGSAIAVDTTDLLFDVATSPNSLKFTAASGTPASELRATFPATVSWANTACRVTIDHKTDSGQGLYWRLQRSGDSNYWNDSSGAWQAGSVDNACAASASRDPANRTISKAVTMDATSRTLTLSVLLQAGGTGSRVSHLYHVQIERGSFPTSRIVTDAAAVTRVKTQLSHDVTTALKSYDPALGAFWCQVTPDWSSSELGSTEDMYLFWMETNGGVDHDALFYDASAGAWVFERKVGGSTYSASKTASVTRGTTYSIGCRWTGVEAELELTAYTISVFVDGVKGTDATSAAPTFTSPETLYRGSDSSFAHQANGPVREVRIFPYAPTDEELARLP